MTPYIDAATSGEAIDLITIPVYLMERVVYDVTVVYDQFIQAHAERLAAQP